MRLHEGNAPSRLLVRTLLAGLLAGTLGACATSPQSEPPSGTASGAGATLDEAVTSAMATDSVTDTEGFDELINRRFEVSSGSETQEGITFHSNNGKPSPKSEIVPNTAEITAIDGLDDQPQRKAWTVMVYVTGTNLESGQSSASNDIAEMYAAGVDFEQANVIYLTGGSTAWSLDVPTDRNVVWNLETLDVVGGSRANSMGDPANLASFVNFADKYFPAEHTMLVMWDHGGGPIVGYGQDELAGGDGLTLPEMAQAMEATAYHGGKKLDVVGCDACLMGSIEIADVWSDYADRLVASEEVEQGIGWNWRFLSVLNDDPEPDEVCTEAVNAFKSYYEGGFPAFSQAPYTLAAYDLTATPDVISAVDELSSALQYDLDAQDYTAINEARNETTEFGFVVEGTEVARFDLFDLRDFCNQFGEDQPAETGKVNEALDRFVTDNATNIPDAYGVMFYLPATSQSLWDMSRVVLANTMGESFRNLTSSYANRWSESAGTSITWGLTQLDPSRAPGEAALSDDGTEYLVPLEDEQVEGLDRASYTVLAYADGAYRPLLADISVSPDDEGVLHVPVDPKVMVLTSTTAEEPVALFAQQVSSNAKATNYICPRIKLIADGSSAEDEGSEEVAAVDVALMVSQSGTDDPVVTGIPFVQTSAAVSRGQANLADYQALSSVLGHALKPERDGEGTLLPYTQWSEDEESELSFGWTEIGDSLELKMVPASELGIEVSCQVTFTDHNGTVHATDLFEHSKD